MERRQKLHFISSFLLQFYKALNIRVALVGLDIWNHRDQCDVSENPFSTLWSFLAWRRKQLARRKHDNAHLITYVACSETPPSIHPTRETPGQPHTDLRIWVTGRRSAGRASLSREKASCVGGVTRLGFWKRACMRVQAKMHVQWQASICMEPQGTRVAGTDCSRYIIRVPTCACTCTLVRAPLFEPVHLKMSCRHQWRKRGLCPLEKALGTHWTGTFLSPHDPKPTMTASELAKRALSSSLETPQIKALRWLRSFAKLACAAWVFNPCSLGMPWVRVDCQGRCSSVFGPTFTRSFFRQGWHPTITSISL